MAASRRAVHGFKRQSNPSPRLIFQLWLLRIQLRTAKTNSESYLEHFLVVPVIAMGCFQHPLASWKEECFILRVIDSRTRLKIRFAFLSGTFWSAPLFLLYLLLRDSTHHRKFISWQRYGGITFWRFNYNIVWDIQTIHMGCYPVRCGIFLKAEEFKVFRKYNT